MHAGAVDELLSSPLGRALVSYSEVELFGLLMNDAYKPKMHKLYAQLYSAVEADFCLNIRRTPFPLRRMFEEVALLLPARVLPMSAQSAAAHTSASACLVFWLAGTLDACWQQ